MVDNINTSVYFPAMRVAGFIMFIFVLLSCFAEAGYDGFSVMDVEFPVMIGEGDRWVEPEDTILYASIPMTFDVSLYLSVHGTVDSVQADSVKRIRYVWAVQNSLLCLQFIPGKIEGEVLPFILPIKLTFFSKRGNKTVKIDLPYSSLHNKSNKNLIYKALLLNDVRPPELTYFPSYFHKLPDKVVYGGYDYSVYRIKLDTLGKPINTEIIFKTEDGLSDRILTVVDFAEFAPAVCRGVKRESELYMTVRFFDTDYPTKSWPPEIGSGASYPVDYLNIETGLYLDSIINPPIPLNIPDGVYHYIQMITLQDSLKVDVVIDTSGTIQNYRVLEESNPAQYTDLTRFFNYLKFTPARDINNRSVVFRGRLTLKRLSSNNIRINTNWLPPFDGHGVAP
jgi:hypothetical protein